MNLIKIESLIISASVMRQLATFSLALSALQIYLYVTVMVAFWFALEGAYRLTLAWIEGKPRRDHDTAQ